MRMSEPDAPTLPTSGRDALLRALGAVGAAVLTAAGLGVLAWAVTRALVEDGGKDGWGDLVAIAVGVVLGVGAGVVAWVVGLGVAARRSFPPGRRLGVVVLTMAATVLGGGLASVVMIAVGLEGAVLSGANVVAFLVVAVLACGVHPWWLRR